MPFDVKLGKCFDLTKKSLQRMALGWIQVGLVWYVHLGTPCTLFPIARKSRPGRSSICVSMECVRFTAEIVRQFIIHGVIFTLENTKTSKLFSVPCIAEALLLGKTYMIELHMCRYGCSYLKPTLIATNSTAFVELSNSASATVRMKFLEVESEFKRRMKSFNGFGRLL